ncbi:Fructose-bisphosphate aldolase 1, chloroplastic [Symbiodinium microadriaticum]|uniref:fructose-bisphosphate aldolase n=1 Tax=Symbiodinium microadriaticum TaxID=2951 RepID=A0A1Q9DU00_SYMMI|nr:Fructose-bisphosphate aldolase 1, chloroplastic [Symbiodinium microadriaticum]CAE7681273.1 ALDCHL [Symbiodinium microadriaticum]CAE7863139.1 ALDCHL [Symbiodinium sp. KB8]
MLREAVAAGRTWHADRLALLCSVALTAAWCQDSIIELVRRLLASDARVKRAEALRSGRRLKVAILGAGMGGSALALWLRDLLGDQVDIALFTNGSIGGRCQALELDGQRYEAGASIISEVNVLFKALMGRFALKKRELSKCNMPLAVFNGTRFLFSTASTAATNGWKFATKLLNLWKLSSRFGFLSLMRLNRLAKRSCAPNFTRLYRALRDGAAYAHPRELLSTLGHSSLHLTQRHADTWLVREMSIPGPIVQELAEPGMRANYGGQGCNALHAFVGLVSIIGGISSKCFAVLGGNYQVAERSVEASEPRVLRASARLIRKDRHVDTSALYEPAFEVGYYALPEPGCNAGPSGWPLASTRGQKEPETEGLRVEAFHIVVVAHPLEHSNLCFEGCCETMQARPTPQFRRCTAHFLRGTLNLRYFAEATFRQATPTELRAAAGAYEADPQASMPLFENAIIPGIKVDTGLVVLVGGFQGLCQFCVQLEAVLLKSSVITPGAQCGQSGDPATVASQTLESLNLVVPPAVPGIMFLSGGQSEIEATLNLNAMNQRTNPWNISFSYACALQNTTLKTYPVAAQAKLLIRAMAKAQLGEYDPATADEDATAADGMYVKAPAQILTTADATTPFYSIGLQLPVDTASPAQIVASAEKGEPQVYKVFAPQPLPEEELDKWFNRCRSSPLHVVDWYAYPQYTIPQGFRPFVLDQDGVFYINAIEQVASAMEMSLIGARNVTNLVADWVAQRRGPRGF